MTNKKTNIFAFNFCETHTVYYVVEYIQNLLVLMVRVLNNQHRLLLPTCQHRKLR